MATVDSTRIRNIVLLSHGGAGKTSLVEALLFAAGATTRQGRVEEGTTVADFDADEHKRGMSVNLAVVSFEHGGCRINLLDTPGYADFIGEVLAGARVADIAAILVDAAAGVQVGTETAWQIAEERRLPRLVVVNRLDRENAGWEKSVAAIQRMFGSRCTPLHLPIGAEGGFTGVIDVLRGRAYLGVEQKAAPVPADRAEAVAAAREALIERIAEANEELMLKYLEGEALSEAEIAAGLKQAIANGTLAPILAAAGSRGLGVRPLLDLIVGDLPSPVDLGPTLARANGAEIQLSVDAAAPPAALIFRTTADEFVGRLTYFRVFSGTLSADSQIWNAQRGEMERLGHLSRIFGKELKAVGALAAGEIGAVTKLTVSTTFDTLCSKEHPVTLPPPVLPAPVFAAAIHPKSKADVDKLGPSLHRLVEEDLTLHVERDAGTGEMILSGLGESHVEIGADKLRRKFKVDVEIAERKIPYRETISTTASAEYLHKKQSGGHGQYARVALRVEPRGRGDGFEFADQIVGGAVPRNYIPAVEKGVLDALPTGVVAHYPLTDLKVVLYDGKHHDVDSSEMAFKIAASQALKEAAQKARPILLEPILTITVTAPEAATGDIMSDLNGRRARVLGMETAGKGQTRIIAEGPMAEFRRYATELRSITGGRGLFQAAFTRYDPVPDHIAKKVIEEARTPAESAG